MRRSLNILGNPGVVHREGENSGPIENKNKYISEQLSKTGLRTTSLGQNFTGFYKNKACMFYTSILQW